MSSQTLDILKDSNPTNSLGVLVLCEKSLPFFLVRISLEVTHVCHLFSFQCEPEFTSVSSIVSSEKAKESNEISL